MNSHGDHGSAAMTAWGAYMTRLSMFAIPLPYIGGVLYDNLRPEAAFITGGGAFSNGCTTGVMETVSASR